MIKNPRFTADGAIDCELDHPQYGWIPFTASPDDPDEGGRVIHQLLLDGQFGDIAPYTPDHAAELAAAIAAERIWRDLQLAATDYLTMPDYPLTETARAELIAYRQALRDWPQSEDFPDQSNRPQPPAWLANQLAEAA